MLFVGIDPGQKGAVACIDDETNRAYVWDMPFIDGDYDERACANLIRSCCEGDFSKIALVTLEHQQIMGEEGRQSAFMIGAGYYIWRGIIVTYGIRLFRPRPADWKKRRLPKGAVKSLSRARAAIDFPNIEHMLLRVMDHDRAEAILLADDGRKLFKEGKI